MSRIGNRVLQIPNNIDIKIEVDYVVVTFMEKVMKIFYNKFLVMPNVYKDKELDLKNPDRKYFKTEKLNSSKQARAQFGTINALVNNAMIGFQVGFHKKLEIVGVGYKVEKINDQLKLNLGHSHPVMLTIPKDVEISIPNSLEINLKSFNKELVGEFAALIRKQRPPEPYKGKGIKYSDEIIIRKVGKSSDGKKK